MEEVKLFGLDAHWWIAIGTFALTAATLLLVLVARHQINSLREENRKAATLTACANYDLNPALYESVKCLWAARRSGDLDRDPEKYLTQLAVVLNYLDGIAIGIDQGLYIEGLAYDHVQAIVSCHVKGYIESGLTRKAGIPSEDYWRLVALHTKWSQATPRFSDRRRWRIWRR